MSGDGLPKAVAFVCPGWPHKANGIVSYTRKMYIALRRKGVRVFVLTRLITGTHRDPDVILLEYPGRERSGLKRKVAKVRERLLPGRDVASEYQRRLIGAIRRLRDRENLEVFQMEETRGWVEAVSAGSETPVVTRLHGPWFLNGDALGVKVDDRFERRVVAEGRGILAAAGVTAPSAHVIDETRRRYGFELPHAEPIPNPIDLLPAEMRWKPEGCDPGRILFVGRFDRHKAGDVVLSAFEIVHRLRPTSRLTFVGPDRGIVDADGRRLSMTEYMEERMSPGARAAIEWLGVIPRENLAPIRRQAAVTIVPSRYENFANTATEALAMGSPLVVSGTGGLLEMVRDGENGLVCRPDDAEHLAERILELLDDPARAARLGRAAGDDAVERYHPDRLAEKTLDYYARVLALRAETRTAR